MVNYAASDVLDTAALACRLPRPAPDLLDREHVVQRMCARIGLTGLPLDGPHINALLGKHRRERDLTARQVRAHGVTNPGSDPQVGDALTRAGARLPLTDSGQKSVAAAVLAPLRGKPSELGELVGAVLNYRHHDTLITTFLEPYQALVAYGDGRARPSIAGDQVSVTLYLPEERTLRAIIASLHTLYIAAHCPGVTQSKPALRLGQPLALACVQSGRCS